MIRILQKPARSKGVFSQRRDALTTCRLLHFLLLILSLSNQFTFAQTPKPESEEVLKIDTQEVMLPVTVRDRSGNFVTGLKATDFKIFEDNSQQPISSFSLRQLTVNVILLIDTSSSVTKEIEDFKNAAQNFGAKLNPTDQLSLIKFDDKVELIMDWTANRNALKRGLNRLSTGMFTHFYDALWLAARDQFKPITGRKAIIVLTDGIDSNRGRKTQDQALHSLLEAEVPVYVVSKTEIQRRHEKSELAFYRAQSSLDKLRIDGIKMSLEALDNSEQWLNKLTEETGGRLFLPTSFDELESVYNQVADELRSQYVIYYTPQNANKDGRYRAVKVTTSTPEYHVTSRLGYYLH